MWTLQLKAVGCMLLLLLLCSSAVFVTAQRSSPVTRKWQTLSGEAPLVIARGGFSGILPDSSIFAYSFAVQTGLPNLLVWCDVQLTKDGFGICFPDILLQNASDIDVVYPDKSNSYDVNGSNLKGWFSIDFTLRELMSVNLVQRIYSRPPQFDSISLQILTVDAVVNRTSPPGLWLNIQHETFFGSHSLSMKNFLVSLSRRVIIDYISSPEVGFLRSLVSRSRIGPKLVFQFLGSNDVEPSTSQTYGSFLNNLTSIRTFATGILVPKDYIWPADASLYLSSPTNLVLDAHKAGLEVYVYNFVNDGILPYNYSYDPVAEYLSYIDNGQFSVDGVLSDFPITASATIDCYSHLGKNDTIQVNISIISSEGASGDFPGCTDLAYSKAVSDGADILDCPVQITSDGVPFCLGSINLRERTNVEETDFVNSSISNPDLKIENGIFAYNLTWNQIQQSLRPAIYRVYPKYDLFRNPAFSNAGELMTLSEFLAFAENVSSISGVLISIENAAYLANKQGLSVIDAVLDAISQSGYNNQTAKKIMIESSDSAVLLKFKSISDYDLVYFVDENVRDISNATILEIREFAGAVKISKRSVFPLNSGFLAGETNLVSKLQSFNLSVFVQHFRNEFVSQPSDLFSDPYVEINQYVSSVRINGLISDFPATASRFRRNRCLGYQNLPAYMSTVEVGDFLQLMAVLPPAEAPSPVLEEDDVVEPPLPSVKKPTGDIPSTPGPTPPPPRNCQSSILSNTIISTIAITLVLFAISRD